MENTQGTSYRDRPKNLDKTGSKNWIYARQPKGKWYTRRTIFAWFAFLFLILAPMLKINGNPLMLFDIVNRKFYIFGQLIWAQDTYLLALIMIITVVSIVLFTVVFGRLWCGWACPQTLFLEMVFRRIEYLFDGNYRPGKSIKTTPFKTISKHIVFFLVSLLITHLFLNWFLGPQKLWQLITSPPAENITGFALVLAISAFYYWIYAYFREQVCTMICPYGRMQGVLLDSKTITVIYDYKRGEPRGSKNNGDCIDCKQCISVCPTGIDIKDGSQLECINCTACIDECNQVMQKIGKPKNLIRFDSYHGVETGKRTLLNTRAIAYSLVLILLFILLGFTLANRTAIDSTILRLPGSMFQQIDDSTYSNIYQAKIINKTQADKNLYLKLIKPIDGEVEFAGITMKLPKNGKLEGVIIIKLHQRQLTGKNTPIEVGLFENDLQLETYETNFIGPEK